MRMLGAYFSTALPRREMTVPRLENVTAVRWLDGCFNGASAMADVAIAYFKVIPTPLHVLGRISPVFSPFFPVFCAFSPSRRGGSNEPKTGIQGHETVSRAPKHRFSGLS